jgi:hypothetical protein
VDGPQVLVHGRDVIIKTLIIAAITTLALSCTPTGAAESRREREGDGGEGKGDAGDTGEGEGNTGEGEGDAGEGEGDGGGEGEGEGEVGGEGEGEGEGDSGFTDFAYSFDDLAAQTQTEVVLPGVRISGPEGVQVFRDSAPFFVTSIPNYIVGMPDFDALTLTFDAATQDVRINLIAFGASGNAGRAVLSLRGALVAEVALTGAGNQFVPVTLDLSGFGDVDKIEFLDLREDDLGIGFDDLAFRQ